MTIPAEHFSQVLKSQLRYTEKREKMKNGLAFAFILIFLFSAHHEGVDAQADCYDSCNMACINPDVRLYRRCDGKCRIKCQLDLAAAGSQG